MLLPAIACLAITFACSKSNPKQVMPLQFWHTFNSEEGVALQRYLQQKSALQVDTKILPFAQAALRFRSGQDLRSCPDLLRIDSTQIASLVAEGAIEPVPLARWRGRNWLPEAEELVQIGGIAYGIPQSLDGLALLRHAGKSENWPPTSLDALERYAMGDTSTGQEKGPGLGLLVDGYWLVPFLRSFQADLPDEAGLPAIDSSQAASALTYFASLFSRGIAMNVLLERSPARAMIRAFRDRKLRVVVSGPWDLVQLSGGELASLEVAPFPGHAAPRGGQVLVVPSCARRAANAWQLALELSAPALQAAWARELGTIPVTLEGLAEAGPLAKAFYTALQAARPLPRHARVPELFDDLTPAVEAVVAGDASASEALAGVARAWRRLYGQANPASSPPNADSEAATHEP